MSAPLRVPLRHLPHTGKASRAVQQWLNVGSGRSHSSHTTYNQQQSRLQHTASTIPPRNAPPARNANTPTAGSGLNSPPAPLITDRLPTRDKLDLEQHAADRPFAVPIDSAQSNTSTTASTHSGSSGGPPINPTTTTKRKHSRSYRFLRGTGYTFIAGFLLYEAYGLYDPNVKEQIQRTSYFWSRMLPIYLHYKYVQNVQLKYIDKDLTDAQQDQVWEDLHNKYADRVLELVLHQRGVYIKLAQIGSVKPDIVPGPYCKRFETLQDGVPPQPGSYAREAIFNAFGKTVDELFSEFSDKALGSATIGQCHAAKMPDGTPVVIKIQYPEVRRLFGSDMSTLKAFVRLAQKEHLPMFDEMEKAFEVEFDFQREAEMMDTIAEAVVPRFPSVQIPKSVPGLVGEYVLVMTQLFGVKMIDGLRREQKKIAKKRGVTVEQLEQEMKAKMASGNTDAAFKAPNPYLIKAYATAKKAYVKIVNLVIGTYNYTLAIVTRHPLQYKKFEPVINPREIIDILNAVHAYEIFELGLANCDCHPGNVFLLDNGRIGLIDYGQTQKFTLHKRLMLAKMIQHLAHNNVQGVVEHYKHMGLKTVKMDPYVIEKLARLGFDDDSKDVTEGMNAQLFFEKLGQIDETLTVPDGYLMASRVGMLLRGLGSWIGVPHTTAIKFLPAANKVLEQNQDEWQRIACGCT